MPWEYIPLSYTQVLWASTPGQKAKNIVRLTQGELESGIDLEQIVFGLVTCPVQSAVESNEVNSWNVDSDATCNISNNKQSFLEFHIPKRPQYVTLGMVILWVLSGLVVLL